LPLVEELGERRVIEAILRRLDIMPGSPVPLGDDASAVDLGGGRLAVIKADMLVGKTDVPPGMTVRQAARKAVVMNVSDLAAKGARPVAVLASLGIPGRLTEGDVEEIATGLNEGAREYGAYVLGGDTNEASDLVISCAALGTCEEGRFMRRSGARPGDILAVTGSFGGAAAGLRILLENLPAPRGTRRPLVDAVLTPRARLREGLALSQTGAVTASIDSSDGLAWSLHELARASGVGFLVDTLPVAREAEVFAEAHGLDAAELALYGGEEYELVITVRPGGWEGVEDAMRRLGTPVTRVGRATGEPTVLLKKGDSVEPIEPRGWEHFKSSRRGN